MERTRKRLNRGLKTYLLQNNSYAIAHPEFDDSYSASTTCSTFISSSLSMYIINQHSCAPLDKHYNLDISEIETRPLELY
jgi:hypothetical protein